MLFILLFLLLAVDSARSSSSDSCQNVETIDITVRDAYCGQPLFLTMLPKTEDNMLLDNVCQTYFPLPDDPDTFQVYTASVFCDGSTSIGSTIETQISIGVIRKANPFTTVTENIIGYTGCDTYLIYVCPDFGMDSPSFVTGISFTCRPIGLSCLRKVQEIIADQGLPEEEFYLLPMKLPNRCVTQQLCLQPPNPFYNKLSVLTTY